MRLLGTKRSPYVRKVRVFAAECGLSDMISLEEHAVHLADHSHDVMKINPLNRIPTLILEDGEVLFESLVIGAYLAQRSGRTDLWPDDAAHLRRVMNTHAVGSGLIDILILRLVEQAKPPERVWPEVMEATSAKIAAVLAHFEQDIDAITAEDCSLGTLTIGVALDYMDFRFQDMDWRARSPKLAAWHQTFTTRASLRDHPFMDAAPALAGRIR